MEQALLCHSVRAKQKTEKIKHLARTPLLYSVREKQCSLRERQNLDKIFVLRYTCKPMQPIRENRTWNEDFC